MKLPFIVAHMQRACRPPGYDERAERLRARTRQTVRFYDNAWERIRAAQTHPRLHDMLAGSLSAFTARPLYYMPWST